MRWKITALVFTIVFTLSAFIAWLAGYDFNHRSPDVAAWVLMTIMFATIVSFFVYTSIKLYEL
jgi:antibiotic biosynthesis monooxygenase (ABM) superfamily enzyme